MGLSRSLPSVGPAARDARRRLPASGACGPWFPPFPGTLRREDCDARLLVKIAPDVSDQQAFEIAKVAEDQRLAGLIATNTTLDHSALPNNRDQQGGLSGAPLRARATHLLTVLNSHSSLPLIASGGVMDAASAKEKFDAGARLVQIYTGLVYRGPQLIREIATLDSELSPAKSS